MLFTVWESRFVYQSFVLYRLIDWLIHCTFNIKLFFYISIIFRYYAMLWRQNFNSDKPLGMCIILQLCLQCKSGTVYTECCISHLIVWECVISHKSVMVTVIIIRHTWEHYSFSHCDLDMKIDHIFLRTLGLLTRWQLYYESFAFVLMLFVQNDFESGRSCWAW